MTAIARWRQGACQLSTPQTQSGARNGATSLRKPDPITRMIAPPTAHRAVPCPPSAIRKATHAPMEPKAARKAYGYATSPWPQNSAEDARINPASSPIVRSKSRAPTMVSIATATALATMLNAT